MSVPEDNGRHDISRTEVARQMRTALAVVTGRAQLMRRRQERGGADGAPTPTDYDAIQSAVGRLEGLIDRLDGQA